MSCPTGRWRRKVAATREQSEGGASPAPARSEVEKFKVEG